MSRRAGRNGNRRLIGVVGERARGSPHAAQSSSILLCTSIYAVFKILLPSLWFFSLEISRVSVSFSLFHIKYISLFSLVIWAHSYTPERNDDVQQLSYSLLPLKANTIQLKSSPCRCQERYARNVKSRWHRRDTIAMIWTVVDVASISVEAQLCSRHSFFLFLYVVYIYF